MRLKYFLLAGLMAALSACAANPFKAASGADEQAYAVLGSYAIYQRQALKIKADTSLPQGVRDAVVKADAAAFPVLKSLDTALVEFLDAKAALAAGATGKDKLAIAVANLKSWTVKAKDALKDLKAAAENARKTFAYTNPAPLNLAWSV